MSIESIIEKFPLVTFKEIEDFMKSQSDNELLEIFKSADKILNKPKEIDDPILEIEKLLNLKEPGDEKLRTVSVFIKVYPVLAIFVVPIAFREEYKGNPAIVYAAILSLPKIRNVLNKTIELLDSLKGDGEKGAKDTIGLIALSIIQASRELARESSYGRIDKKEALGLFEVAEHASKIYGDDRLEMDVKYAKAIFFFSLKNYEEAARLLKELDMKIESSQEYKNMKVALLIKLGLAQSYYYLNKYEESLDILDKVLEQIPKGKKTTELIFALYFKGKNLLAIGKKEEGVALIREAMNIAKDLDIVSYNLIKNEMKNLEKESKMN